MNRRFGVGLISTPALYLMNEEEAYKHLKNAYSYLKRQLEKRDYDYSLLIGLSNMDGKTVSRRFDSKNKVGRPPVSFISRDPNIPLKTTNYHFHVLVCGAPLSTLIDLVSNYFQKIINKLIVLDRLDDEVYNKIEVIRMLIYNKKETTSQKCKVVPKTNIYNLNVHVKKGNHEKDDYIRIRNYIINQSSKTRRLKSDNFTFWYFDYAKKSNKVAKIGYKKDYNISNTKEK